MEIKLTIGLSLLSMYALGIIIGVLGGYWLSGRKYTKELKKLRGESIRLQEEQTQFHQEMREALDKKSSTGL
jgi:uncharacterized protein YneF (UPF0154 family)